MPGPFFPLWSLAGSHRLRCEPVGRRPLRPAVLGYPSDIQLFRRKEAHFLAAWGPGFQEACVTPACFQLAGWVSLFTAYINELTCSFLSLAVVPEGSDHIPGQGGS